MPQAFQYEIIKKAYERVCIAAPLYLLRKERLKTTFHLNRFVCEIIRQGQKQLK